MKILCKVDENLSDKKINPMLDKLKHDYKGVTPVKWEVEDITGNLPWEVYSGDDKGIAKYYIQQDTARIWDKRGYELDHVVYFVSRENWEAHGIGGWNLGKLYNNYAVQIVLAEQSGKWAGKTLAMEIAHCWDEFAPVELGVDLNTAVLGNADSNGNWKNDDVKIEI